MEMSWLPYLAGLLSERPNIPEGLTPEARKARTFEALRLLCLHGSRRRPLVLVVEDVHWIDPTSEEFLRALATDVETSPILLVSTHRPGYRPPWLSLPGASQLALALRCRPTTPRASSGRRRAADRSPSRSRRRSWSAPAGNPLFLEELTQAAGEDGGADADPAVPPHAPRRDRRPHRSPRARPAARPPDRRRPGARVPRPPARAGPRRRRAGHSRARAPQERGLPLGAPGNAPGLRLQARPHPGGRRGFDAERTARAAPSRCG